MDFATTQADAAYLDIFTNVVPYDCWIPEQQQGKKLGKLQPDKGKSTSELLKEAAKGPSRPKTKKGANLTREELRLKLHSKIDQLKEKQRTDQSTRDKASKEAQASAPGSPVAGARSDLKARLQSKISDHEMKRKKPGDKRPALDVGHIQVVQKAADLTLSELSGNAPGSKKRRLAQLIQEDAAAKAALDAVPAAERGEAKKQQELAKALQRASGERVFDQSTKLKKALKQIEAKKSKTKQKWTDKVSALQQEMLDKHEQRKENVKNKRNRGKPDAAKTPKDEKQRAGFEGKRKGFLNSM